MKLSENEQKKLITQTKENLRLRGLSNNTIRNYEYDLKLFFKKCNYNGDLSDFTEDDFLAYLRKEFLEKNLSSNTYNAHIAAVKKMFIVYYRKSFINDLVPRAKTAKRLPIIVTIEEFRIIFNKENNLKHRCWLLLSFFCGLRACEVVNVTIESINAQENSLRIIGKGNKERVTILPKFVIDNLRAYYISKNMKKTSGYLFEANKNSKLDHISSETAVNYFISLKNKYNLNKRYTFHSLRHSFATYYLMYILAHF